jgi:hypothetical protein
MGGRGDGACLIETVGRGDVRLYRLEEDSEFCTEWDSGCPGLDCRGETSGWLLKCCSAKTRSANKSAVIRLRFKNL